MQNKIEKFEDIIAWQKAKEFTLEVYGAFGDCRDFSFRDQIRRASLSVMNNIAEGFERRTDRELSHFLFIAKGSSGEVRSMLYIALEQGYINKDQFDEIYKMSVEISRILSGFIKSIK